MNVKLEESGGNNKRSTEYGTWANMKCRCNCKSAHQYKDYGGRGIKVCKEWDDYATFLHDMGRKPDKTYSIERIDNDGNYEPSNCRWATRLEQAKNCRRRHIIRSEAWRKNRREWVVKTGWVEKMKIARKLARERKT
jgi:hypothetical protein